MENRVVVTGMGMITAAGNNVKTSWERVLSGETAIDKITAFDISGYKATLAAEVKNFNPENFVDEKKEVRRLDRFTQFALAATHEAVITSGLDFKSASVDPAKCGVIYGSGVGGMNTLETDIIRCHEKGPSRVSPLFIPMLISNMAAGHISIKYGLEGHGFCPVTACSTGTHAVGEAYRAIKHGYADIIIAGGAESTITPASVAGFQNMTALSNGQTKEDGLLAFDRRRTGFVMGEGAGTLILENMDSAIGRGAVIYGEIVGYCANFDAHHITAPSPDGKGAATAVRKAIEDAKTDKKNIGYVNAHGTGTPINDRTETTALKAAFGEYAGDLLISSTKGVTGHILGATGAVETIFCIMAMRDGILPPTANLYESDPECDLNYIPLKAVEKKVDYALNISLGFGATNAAVVIRSFT